MEKDRSAKIIAIVALVIAITGLSLGFASFSQNLTIKASADVKPEDDKFKVRFSTTQDSVITGELSGEVTPSGSGIAENATLSDTKIEDIKATFSKDGGVITYNFYVRNDGEMDAFLKSVVFSNVKPVCTAVDSTNTNDSLVQAACDKVKISLTVDGHTYSATDNTISNVILSKQTGATVKVELKAESGATTVDGNYTVDFGSITLNYNSKD